MRTSKRGGRERVQCRHGEEWHMLISSVPSEYSTEIRPYSFMVWLSRWENQAPISDEFYVMKLLSRPMKL
jgi:hypothetical protein